ncbi:MAG: corrinoid protein [Fidelibacterota bacterium]|nr:MAG: corrinoid protein [Candidatus Neomarinimicrobiota bacterium]
MEVLEQISSLIQQGDNEKVLELTSKAINKNISPKDVLDEGLVSGMNAVGERFKNHEIFLPEVLMAARAFYAGMDQLKPLLIRGDLPDLGKIVIGTVQGDLHDIGKNLVGIMLRGAGFEVIDLGKDIPAQKFVETAKHEQAEIIGMSALLTTTQPAMKTVIELLREQGLNARIRTIVGGAPVSEEYAREIGADAYAYDAASAVERVKQLMEVE